MIPAPARASVHASRRAQSLAARGHLCDWVDADDISDDAAHQLPPDSSVSLHRWRPRDSALAAVAAHTWFHCELFLQTRINRLSETANVSWIGGAVILTLAGTYQFSSLKYACLDKCRSPLALFMSRWQRR